MSPYYSMDPGPSVLFKQSVLFHTRLDILGEIINNKEMKMGKFTGKKGWRDLLCEVRNNQ